MRAAPRPPPHRPPCSWAQRAGIGAGIRLASWGALRGCAAARDLMPGDLALSIPVEALVYEDTVRQTDLVGGWVDGRAGGWVGGRGGGWAGGQEGGWVGMLAGCRLRVLLFIFGGVLAGGHFYLLCCLSCSSDRF